MRNNCDSSLHSDSLSKSSRMRKISRDTSNTSQYDDDDDDDDDDDNNINKTMDKLYSSNPNKDHSSMSSTTTYTTNYQKHNKDSCYNRHRHDRDDDNESILHDSSHDHSRTRNLLLRSNSSIGNVCHDDDDDGNDNDVNDDNSDDDHEDNDDDDEQSCHDKNNHRRSNSRRYHRRSNDSSRNSRSSNGRSTVCEYIHSSSGCRINGNNNRRNNNVKSTSSRRGNSSSGNSSSGNSSSGNSNGIIALFGAYGCTGKHFLRLALDAGYQVRAMLLPSATITTKHNNTKRIITSAAIVEEFCEQQSTKQLIWVPSKRLDDPNNIRQVLLNVDYVVCMLNDTIESTAYTSPLECGSGSGSGSGTTSNCNTNTNTNSIGFMKRMNPQKPNQKFSTKRMQVGPLTKFINVLYPLMMEVSTIQVFLYESTSFTIGIDGTVPVLSNLLQKVSTIGSTSKRNFYKDHNTVIESIAYIHHHYHYHHQQRYEPNHQQQQQQQEEVIGSSKQIIDKKKKLFKMKSDLDGSENGNYEDRRKDDCGGVNDSDDDMVDDIDDDDNNNDDDDTNRSIKENDNKDDGTRSKRRRNKTSIVDDTNQALQQNTFSIPTTTTESNRMIHKQQQSPHFSYIVTRPTVLIHDRPSIKQLHSTKSQPGPFPITNIDLAEFSLNALVTKKLYNTCPYVCC